VSRPGLFGESYALDPTARDGSRRLDTRHQELSRQSALLAQLDSRTKQATLGRIALLPVIMLACYLALITYFRKAGGYRAERLVPDAAGGVAPQL
jgi:hypothetical protein